MYYTQRDGRRYHYISDPKFEQLFALAEEWEHGNRHSELTASEAKSRERLESFDSGDAVGKDSGDWEMRATLYGWTSGSLALEVKEILHSEDGSETVEIRWYGIPKEDYLKWKEGQDE